eukprot:scaffold584_cov132-Cylindrotheca_fusiformis.AAC.34
MANTCIVQAFLLCSLLLVGINAQIRGGKSIESLRNRLLNAKDEALSRGEIHQRFGAFLASGKNSNSDNGRKLEETGSIEFMGIYNEIGTADAGATPFTVGAVFGLNGFLYDTGTTNVIGSLEGSCTVSASDKEHFCTYHMLFGDGSESDAGLVVAAGSLTFAEEDGGFLIVEATAYDLSGYDGGVFTLKFKTISGGQPVFAGSLDLY